MRNLEDARRRFRGPLVHTRPFLSRPSLRMMRRFVSTRQRHSGKGRLMRAIARRYCHAADYAGIGPMLVEQAVRNARKVGVRFLSVRPVARNVEAFSFFVQAGFNIVGHTDLFQDLGRPGARKWKAGIVIHNQQLRY